MLSTLEIPALLRGRGIPPTAQRLAVAEYVLTTEDHPSADEVLVRAKERLPMLSRATVYNTLHLLVDKGLLRELTFAGGRIVYDCNVIPHHHFIDEQTGIVHDIPFDAVRVSKLDLPPGFDVREYMVVMRGRKKGRTTRS
jgi:Fur family transcriptional regulator, iron response regulator